MIELQTAAENSLQQSSKREVFSLATVSPRWLQSLGMKFHIFQKLFHQVCPV